MGHETDSLPLSQRRDGAIRHRGICAAASSHDRSGEGEMIGGIAMGAAFKSVPKWAWIGLGAVLLLGAFYLALNAYGNSRYREGKADADAAWIAAHNKLIEDAANARGEADAGAAAREAEFAAQVEDEKERIDEAIKEGSSPLDVLFGR